MANSGRFGNSSMNRRIEKAIAIYRDAITPAHRKVHNGCLAGMGIPAACRPTARDLRDDALMALREAIDGELARP
jgi:hypothetical protein